MSKKVKTIISFVLIMGLIISTPNVDAQAASPKLSKKAVTITIGNTVGLTVKNTTNSVKWSSSNKAVAKVDADGDVTAKKAGKAKITAKVGKKKFICNVTVPKQYISSKSLFIEKGSKQKLNVYGVSKSDSLFWGSDYENIATVTQSGEITANAMGETTVYAVLNNGNGKMYECQVVVYEKTNSGVIVTATPRPIWTLEPTNAPNSTSTPSGGTAVTKVTLSSKTLQVEVSKQKKLEATVLPESAINKRVTWNSGNTAVAKVGSDGTVTGISAGNTIVYVTTSDGEFIAVCNVIVSGASATPTPSVTPVPTATPSPTPVPTPKPSVVPVEKVTLSNNMLQLNAGDSRTLTAAVLPADASDKSVIWRSGNDSVARVDSTGRVTAIAAGATVVLVTTLDGEYSAICTVTVTGTAAVPTPPTENTPEPTPTPLVLNKTSLGLLEGQTDTLNVTGASATGTVQWQSSSTDVAEVSTDGKVTAKKAGSAVITVSQEGRKSASCNVTVSANTAAVFATDVADPAIITGCTNKDLATRIEIPAGTTKISDNAFKGMTKLWSVSIPDGVTEIGQSAFEGCTALKSVSIPKSVTEIAEKTFSGCSALTSLTISEGVTKINSQAFAGCTALKEIRIPENVTDIADDAFEHDKDIKIFGKSGSAADRWAQKEGVTFVPDEDGDGSK